MALSDFDRMRAFAGLTACLARAGVACLCVAGTPGSGLACERADFEAVVSETASALRDLNQKNKPPFQARLKDLKDKRGWSYDQFLKEAAPFVQDAKITEFDERSAAFLEKIQTMGEVGAGASPPQCATLNDVRGVMQALVAAQKDKWSYMFGKIEQELKR